MHHSNKSLIQLLDEAGIARIYKTLDIYPYKQIEFLEYNGKRIDCPTAYSCYQVVKREFGIDFTTFND
jgi:hypothetical protein